VSVLSFAHNYFSSTHRDIEDTLTRWLPRIFDRAIFFRNGVIDKYNNVVNEDLQETIPLLWSVYVGRGNGRAPFIVIADDIGSCIKARAKGIGTCSTFEDDEIPPKLRGLSCIINRRNMKSLYE
jgi:hypothetical protein